MRDEVVRADAAQPVAERRQARRAGGFDGDDARGVLEVKARQRRAQALDAQQLVLAAQLEQRAQFAAQDDGATVIAALSPESCGDACAAPKT